MTLTLSIKVAKNVKSSDSFDDDDNTDDFLDDISLIVMTVTIMMMLTLSRGLLAQECPLTCIRLLSSADKY